MAKNVTPDTLDISIRHLDIQGAELKIGDTSSTKEMLVMLDDLLIASLPAIDQALDSGDLASAASHLHSLKGCMPIFCGPGICDSVGSAEQAAKDGLTVEARDAFALLRPLLQQLQLEIQNYLVVGANGPQPAPPTVLTVPIY